MSKKVASNQFNLFGGVGAVTETTQTKVMALPGKPGPFHEGAYLTCDLCGTRSRVVYIPVTKVEPKDWKDWVKAQVGWDEDCPSCEDKARFIERQRQRDGTTRAL